MAFFCHLPGGTDIQNQGNFKVEYILILVVGTEMRKGASTTYILVEQVKFLLKLYGIKKIDRVAHLVADPPPAKATTLLRHFP